VIGKSESGDSSMRRFQLGYRADEVGLEQALPEWASASLSDLQRAVASGELDEPDLGPLGQELKKGAK